MRHRRRVKHFSRDSKARRALLRGLMISLVEHGRIKTTVDKAKELRRHIEKAITVGKAGDLAARRLLLSRIANVNAVETIVGDISKRFSARPGGYTRIIKIGRRPGDTAEMAFIEFVDYAWDKAAAADSKSEKADKSEKATKKVVAKVAKKTAKLVAAKKKSTKKIEKKARQAARK
jgi:large subunit ribosomal protein L17